MPMDRPKFFDYYAALLEDVYYQKEDYGHLDWTRDAINKMFMPYSSLVSKVLDVGCGSGVAEELFPQYYVGITINEDEVKLAEEKGRNVRLGDMNFLPYVDESFDLVFSRHTLEHSPFPIITLMEWYRVSRKYLFLIVPCPDFWGYGGKNHYSVANKEQLWYWLDRAGWQILLDMDFKTSDPAFIQHYSDNFKRRQNNKPLIAFPGAPKIVEYRLFLRKKHENWNSS